jgi:protein-S-isoprenylcysteine O-methyltransferase Ste14
MNYACFNNSLLLCLLKVISMELFPQLELSILGGWLSLLPMLLIQFINIFGVSEEARKRLFDRSNYTSYQKLLLVISKITAMIVLLLLVFTPLSAEPVEIIIGTLLIFCGVVGVRIAVLNFINTPPNEPVTQGLYKYSRNPQEVMLTIIFIGASISISSWSVLVILFISKIFNHISIIAQEQVCLQQYGDSYKAYMKQVPRYLLFF